MTILTAVVVSLFHLLEWNTISSLVSVSARQMQEKSRTSRPLRHVSWNMGVYPGDPALISRADTTLLPEKSILGLSWECSSPPTLHTTLQATSDGLQLLNIRIVSQILVASSAIHLLNNALTLLSATLRFVSAAVAQTTSDGPQLSNIRNISQLCEASSAITPLNNALTLPPAILRFCFTVADQTTNNGPQVLNIRNISQLCGASSAITPLNNALTLSSCHTSTLFEISEATSDPTAADPTRVSLAASTAVLTAAEATALRA